jgi:shikimate dehydrogenase
MHRFMCAPPASDNPRSNAPLLGLIGAGIQRSLTPAMHVEEAGHHGLRVHYQLIDLDTTCSGLTDLPGLMHAARVIGFAGLNITYPCKQAVIAQLDGLSVEARAMGAVNTVVARGGRWVGHNTDGSGWAWGFRRALPGADLSEVVLLGAGGAGRAIAHAVLGLGARRLRIHDLDAGRAVLLASDLRSAFAADVEAIAEPAPALQRASGLIHATPTGMDKLPGLPLPAAHLHPGLWVAEAVYFPLDTPLLRAARALGCATMDGGAMAVGQAVGAFELFTGLAPDAERMQRHFHQLLHARGD